MLFHDYITDTMFEGWEEWVDTETIKACIRHASGAIVAVVIFLVIGLAIHFGTKDNRLRSALESIDSFALVGLFVWLVYQTGCVLWNRRVKVERAKRL